MAQSEAAHTLRLLNGRRPPYGVWLDVEDSSLPSGEALIDNVAAYCQAVEKAGLYCGIYASLSWMETRLNSPRLDPYDKWVAQWSSQLDYTKPYGIWQFTNQLVLNGKTFDGDWAYKDYPALTGGKEDEDMTQAEVTALARQRPKRSIRRTRKSTRPWPLCRRGQRRRWSRCTGSWGFPAPAPPASRPR